MHEQHTNQKAKGRGRKALRVFFIVMVVLYGINAILLFRIATSRNENDSYIAKVHTDFGHTLTLTKTYRTDLWIGTGTMSVQCGEQTLSTIPWLLYPRGAAGDEWYYLIEQTEVEEGYYIYRFSWCTLTIRDGQLQWQLDGPRALPTT